MNNFDAVLKIYQLSSMSKNDYGAKKAEPAPAAEEAADIRRQAPGRRAAFFRRLTAVAH